MNSEFVGLVRLYSWWDGTVFLQLHVTVGSYKEIQITNYNSRYSHVLALPLRESATSAIWLRYLNLSTQASGIQGLRVVTVTRLDTLKFDPIFMFIFDLARDHSLAGRSCRCSRITNVARSGPLSGLLPILPQ